MECATCCQMETMERKTNTDRSKGQENSSEVGGGAGKGCVGERLWLVGVHTEFICATGVKAGLCLVGHPK